MLGDEASPKRPRPRTSTRRAVGRLRASLRRPGRHHRTGDGRRRVAGASATRGDDRRVDRWWWPPCRRRDVVLPQCTPRRRRTDTVAVHVQGPSRRRPVDVATGGLAADSLGCRRVGDLAFALAERYVGEFVLGTDMQTQAAQHWLWQECRVIAEPGGAPAPAALLAGHVRTYQGASVAVIICGANSRPDLVMNEGVSSDASR